MEGVISLFLGTLLDALIGPNLFVPGEPFMLAAGYQLQQGIISGVIAVLLGGFIGDQASYFIGKRLGKSALKRLINWQSKIRRPIARCRLLMARRGNLVLVVARLLGPVAWVVPFIAGTQKMAWGRFTLFSSIGLFLGIGQFVFWGYMLGYGIEQFELLNNAKVFLIEHKLSFYVVGATLAMFVLAKLFHWRAPVKLSLCVLLVSILSANYAHFFLYSDDFLESDIEQAQASHPVKLQPEELVLKAYPGKSPVFDAQAINIIYFGDNPRVLMNDMGWIENKTFSRNDIELSDYIALIEQKIPPVSDLFWNGRPQDMAFQLPGDLLNRRHIRWWKAGVDPESNQVFWVAALSYDNGLQIMPYSGIITILHSIDPNVDSERDLFARQMMSNVEQREVRLDTYTDPVVLDEEHDYYSDGKVLIVSEPDTKLVNLL